MSGPFAILRVERVVNAGELARAAGHMLRARPTPNADPHRASDNRVVIGSDDPAADVRRCRDAVKLRTNSGWGVEVLLTASPGWWRQATPEQQRDWQKRSVRWLEAEFGREHIAHLRWHRDETSPHLTGFVIPTKQTKDGRAAYSAEHLLGGREKMERLQDRYAEQVASLGLQRGVRGSAATHESIRDYYRALNAGLATTLPAVEVPPLAVTNGARQRWADEQTQRIHDAAQHLGAAARDLGRERKRVGEMRATAKVAQARAERAERISDRVRDVPLDQVLSRWGGLERDQLDRHQWKATAEEGGAGARRITTKGGKWMDHAAGKGGGGAIDLVVHLSGWPPKEAIGWLAREFGVDTTARAVAADALRQAEATAKAAAAAPAPELPLPPERAPVPARWTRARAYLVETRQLPAALVDAEHQAGRLWADGRGSLVWPLTDEDGRRVGYEWRAARAAAAGERRVPRGVIPGSRSGAGAYDLPAARPDDRRVLVVEGALDALAARASGFHGRILGLAGSEAGRGLLAALAARLTAAARWLVGLDADRAGDRASAALAPILPGSERVRPREGCKDWSDLWRRRVEQAPSPPALVVTVESRPAAILPPDGDDSSCGSKPLPTP